MGDPYSSYEQIDSISYYKKIYFKMGMIIRTKWYGKPEVWYGKFPEMTVVGLYHYTHASLPLICSYGYRRSILVVNGAGNSRNQENLCRFHQREMSR